MENKWLLKYPIAFVFLIQILLLFLIRNILFLIQLNLSGLTFALIIAMLSGVIIHFLLRLPKGFIVISSLLPFLILLAFKYQGISSSLYGVFFLLFALTFSHTFKERVPLYLTNQTTHFALKKMIEDHRAKKVIDLGCGLGGVVRALSLPGIQSIGVESAPLVWLISSGLSFMTGKGEVLRKNIWETNLSEFDVVYAFLSPAIMEDLYKKVKKEMKPGALFISNSFCVPGINNESEIVLSDSRQTKLYIYEM